MDAAARSSQTKQDLRPATLALPVDSDVASDANQRILEAAGDGIYGIDADGLTTFANPAAERMTGWSPGELIGKSQHAYIHHSHADGRRYAAEMCPIYGTLRDGLAHHSETEVFWRKDGTCFPVAYTSTPIFEEGRPAGAVVLFRDVTGRKRKEAWELARSAIFTAITSHQELDATLGKIANAAGELFPGCPVALLVRHGSSLRLAAHAGVPQNLRRLLANIATMDGTLACARAAEQGVQVGCVREDRFDAGYTLVRRKGEQVYSEADARAGCRELTEPGCWSCLAVPLLAASGDVVGVVALFNMPGHRVQEGADGPGASGPTDTESTVSETVSVGEVFDLARLAIEHQLLHAELLRQSQHDHLTGLPSRLLLEDRLARALVHARRHGTLVAVCHLDIDQFQQINDTLGHDTGDVVLRRVAHVLKRGLKEKDTVAREGGDEFLLFLSDLQSEREADAICDRILKELRTPIMEGRHTVCLTASLGRSLYPPDGETATELLQNADLALYAAKFSGRNRLQAFDAELGERIKRDLEMQWELRFAIERGQLRVAYQPLYSLDGRLVSFEALLRWVHPGLGAVNPEVFIPIAEKSGSILAMGEWVLEQACRQAFAWNEANPDPVRISVNVSGVQLGQPDFTAIVAEVLARSGLLAHLLDLEITETSIVADIAAVSAKLHELRALGIHISIDDFGCGHSSFSYLQSLPIDTLKIDRSFIAPLDGTEKKSAIVRAIVALAEELGLQTVAEGVETEQQMADLRTTQCGLLQGYYFSKPLTPEAAQRLILNRSTKLAAPVVAAVLPNAGLLLA